ELLLAAGQVDEAIAHFQNNLRLNPRDKQRFRYPPSGCYLATGNARGPTRIFADYPDEGSAMFAWSYVHGDFLAGDEAAAAKAVVEARKVNKHVEAFLTGRKNLPAEGPSYYSPGEPSEAVVCIHEIGGAWEAHPQAVAWLKQQKPKRG